HVEGRQAGLDQHAVVDQARVRPTPVGGQEVADRVAAALLLSVTGDADVHREVAGAGQPLHGLEQGVELALVVCDPTCVEDTVAYGRLERRALPELEWIGRLDVEMAVDEDGRRVGARRGPT